jgi:hypothetical protein
MAARKSGLNSNGWPALMNDVLHLPLSMLPAVRRVVKQGAWRQAIDPIACVKAGAERDCRRGDLPDWARLAKKPTFPKGE